MMSRNRLWVFFSILAGLILVTAPTTSSNAADDYATQILSTSAQIVFTGTAALTPSVSISEEIQIQPLTADFSKDPIGWDMTLWSDAGLFFGHVHWFWSKATGPGFSWNMADTNHTNSNLGGATCSDTDGFCYLDTPNWNLSDPFRVNIGADNSLGAGWWRATILDLANGQMLNLGSMTTPKVVNLTNLVVKHSIYRTTAVSACPGDLAPTADTYFGPIVDSTGAEDANATGQIITHSCANAELGKLTDIAGAYMVYGGSINSIESVSRKASFKPSPLLTTTAPPIPQTPSKVSPSPSPVATPSSTPTSPHVPTPPADNSTSEPPPPDSIQVITKGKTLTFTVAPNRLAAAAAANAYIVCPQINGGSKKPIAMIRSGIRFTYSTPVISAVKGKILKWSVYLSNRIGNSRAIIGSYKIP